MDQGIKKSVPFSGSYWVVPDQFLAGCYPGFCAEGESAHILKAIIEQWRRIGVVIFLTILCVFFIHTLGQNLD